MPRRCVEQNVNGAVAATNPKGVEILRHATFHNFPRLVGRLAFFNAERVSCALKHIAKALHQPRWYSAASATNVDEKQNLQSASASIAPNAALQTRFVQRAGCRPQPQLG